MQDSFLRIKLSKLGATTIIIVETSVTLMHFILQQITCNFMMLHMHTSILLLYYVLVHKL